MSWWRTVAACVSLLSVVACTTVSNPLSCADGFCSDPAFPFCDVDGTIGGGGRLTCIAVACTPLAFEACRGDDAIICNATGDGYDITRCESGCSPERAGCAATHIVPKYLPTVCDSLATEPALTISESVTLDTSDDASCNGGVVAQVNGPEICVLRYGAVTVETNKTLKVTGSRALAIVADDALTIDGVLDVSADKYRNGPGGGLVISALDGGGAGFRTPGAPGGTFTEDGGANNGGPAMGDPALLVELVGGTSTGTSISPGATYAGGGGAATLIACRNEVAITGLIDAGGGGGAGGGASISFGWPATGGGSGGHVVVQGMRVSVTGRAFANGGGGGAGRSQANAIGAAGQDGALSSVVAAQGGVSEMGEGPGGAGGLAKTPPTFGRKVLNTSCGCSPGGGGGSIGYLRIYTPAGAPPTIQPAAASPAFDADGVIATSR